LEEIRKGFLDIFMKLRSKKSQVLLVTGILWFVILPAFLLFSALSEADANSHSSLEKNENIMFFISKSVDITERVIKAYDAQK